MSQNYIARILPVLLLLLTCDGQAQEKPLLPNDDCSLTIGNPYIDYGQLTHEKLREHSNDNDRQQFTLEKRQVTLQALCSEPRLMTLRFQSSAADQSSYRFGPGHFQLELHSATLDEQPAQLSLQDSGNGAQQKIVLTPGKSVSIKVEGGESTARRLQLQVEITTYLPRTATQIRDQVEWQGNGKFELRPYVSNK